MLFLYFTYFKESIEITPEDGNFQEIGIPYQQFYKSFFGIKLFVKFIILSYFNGKACLYFIFLIIGLL